MAVPKKKLSPVEARAKARETTYSVAGSAAEHKEMQGVLNDMENDIAARSSRLSDYIAQSEDWLNKPEQIEKKKSPMNAMFERQMIMACVMPLSRGLSVDSIITSAGMYAGICLVNKDFKNNVKEYIGSALAPHVDTFAEYVNKKHPDNTRMGELAKKAQAWRDNFIKEQNGGRMPYTPQSAAVQDLAIHTMAYRAMRQPGADIEKIKHQHEEARQRLFELAKRDGISRDSICEQVRIIVGKQSMAEERNMGFKSYEESFNGRMNNVSTVFTETATGSFQRDDYHEESILMHDTTGKPYMRDTEVWTGEYFTNGVDGEKLYYEGDFTPREPMSEEYLANSIKGTYDYAVNSSKDGKDFFNKMFAVYHSTHGHPKEAMRFAQDDMTKEMAVNNYSTYICAAEDGFDDIELDDKSTQLWNATVKFMLEHPYGKHCEWRDDFLDAFKTEMKEHGDLYGTSSFVQDTDYNTDYGNTQPKQREYHSPAEPQTAQTVQQQTDNSINGRGEQYDNTHRHLLQESNDGAGVNYSI